MATQTIAPAGPAPQESGEPQPAILVEDVDIAYGDFVIQQHLDFAVRRGEIFVIMGGSGCGKTTVMRAMVGLKAPARGQHRDRRHQLLGGRPRGARAPRAQLRHRLPERRACGAR